MIIDIKPDYRTIEKLEEKWGCTASDIFNWGAEGLLKIWDISELRKNQDTSPISSKKANQIYFCIGLAVDDISSPDITGNASIDLENLLSHDDKLRVYDHEYEILNDYVVKNEEIQRIEQEFFSQEHGGFTDKHETIKISKIKLGLDYRTIAELANKWECTISNIFEWAVNGEIKIWDISNIRLNQDAKQITHEKVDELFQMLTLEGMELVDHLDCGFNPKDYNLRTGREYVITNKEIKRFEEKNAVQESEEERKKRLAKQQEEKEEQEHKIAEKWASIEAEVLRKFEALSNSARANNTKQEPKTFTLEIPAEHHYYPRHIAIMIHCWNAIYRDMPKDVRLKNNHAYIIYNWLAKKYLDRGYISKKYLKHIAIAVNPYPKGLTPSGSVPWEFTESREDSDIKTRLDLYEGHPHPVIEPPIAIYCWNALYLERDPDAPKPEGGHKNMIKNWLNKNYGNELTNSAQDRLVQIINPRFKGWDSAHSYTALINS